VVRPAPLRPSSVTTSPWSTLMSMPCRTCDSPYQACRLLMCSSVSSVFAVAASVMSGSHVGRHHGPIVRYFRVRSFRQHFALVEHGNRVRQLGDDTEVVLYHEHRTVGRDLADQLC